MPSPSSPGLELPERYSVLRHIANGGMASVWEARDEVLGRHVAVKVLSPAYAADDAARRRFTREARAAARLSTHPHVVTVYDTGDHDGQAFLVMALYPGGTVAERLAGGPVGRTVALTWLHDAAGALDAAHAEGVVHRDVKPANLLLDAADRVAVADFGIATAAWETSVTSTGMVLGTMAYLAPEQRVGGVATPASDRYALGLVARELLTGARPGSDPAAAVALPGAVEIALQHATAEDPAARPPTCAALVDELDAALDARRDATAVTRATPVERTRVRAAVVAAPAAGSATAAAAPGRPPHDLPPRGAAPLAPAPRRRRAPALLALLAGLALMIGLAAVLFGGGGSANRPGSTSTAATQRPATTAKPKPKPAAPTASSSSAATQPPPATTTQATPTTPSPGGDKSRAQLIEQNNRAFAATAGAPAAQVPLLQEAVTGLCKDESDLNCAFALFNLAKALRLSGQAAAAVPLLERRLSISDNQVPAVQAELAAARAAAGGGQAAPAPGKVKGTKKGKD